MTYKYIITLEQALATDDWRSSKNLLVVALPFRLVPLLNLHHISVGYLFCLGSSYQ